MGYRQIKQLQIMRNYLIILTILVNTFILVAQDTETPNPTYPEVTYPDIDGNQINISKLFKKKELSIVVFAIYHGGSIEQIKAITDSYDELSKKYDLQVIIIAPSNFTSPEKLKKYVSDDCIFLLDEVEKENFKSNLKISKDVPLDRNGSAIYFPQTLFVSKDGTIPLMVGAMGQKLKEHLEELIIDFFKKIE